MMALDGARRRFDGRHDVSCCDVAVSGDRLRNAANRLQLEMWLRCVCAPNLREFIQPRPPPAISPCGQGARLGHRAAGYRAAI